jgi:hypothetical protein
LGKLSFREQLGVSGILAETLHLQVGSEPQQAGIMLPVSAIEPIKGLVHLTTIGIRLRNLISGIIRISRDEAGQSFIGFSATSECVVGERLAKIVEQILRLFLHFNEGFLRATLGEVHLTSNLMNHGHLVRIQV